MIIYVRFCDDILFCGLMPYIPIEYAYISENYSAFYPADGGVIISNM